VDVLTHRDLIRAHFPTYARDVATVIHIRRAGSISTQQMGQVMLQALRDDGARLVRAEVTDIAGTAPFVLTLAGPCGPAALRADRIVNAAGPRVGDVAAMLGEQIAVKCVYQQKIAFQDRDAAIPRSMPFTIDLDAQTLAWTQEDRELLAGEPTARHLLEPMKGGIHCRPDGSAQGTWIKLGWAYNEQPTDPHDAEPIDTQFPDTVLRGASRLHPRLASYIGRLPRGTHHYGGYYTMTDENWPLIGRMRTDGAFIAGALSGFGSMAACAAGAVCAAIVVGAPVAPYARWLSGERYANAALMAELAVLGKGSL
jgi:glycine/D-amino acid oxidase-like deaminating enzyme